ncbi:ABC transporter-like protein [Lophiostoma macrostomum CBS 122681]|uniref:ABC transporter-like protein n=1 Tax=Lophiostoma macrostomum CBS 122681 TaxID=1314788 RepID=A0A6A6SLL0_9PLEO|nr:ABC transporter-like protein [Lophiostoma macrostomum CBS 122681]
MRFLLSNPERAVNEKAKDRSNSPTSEKSFVSIALLLQCLGAGAALAAGTARPLMAVIFGGLVNVYNDKGDKTALKHTIDRQVLLLVVIFLAQWLVTCAYAIFFSISAMRRSMAIRSAYLKALVSQDIDSVSESRTATDLSTNISVIEDALSEKLGTVLQALSTVLTSLIIAFTRSWQLTLCMLFMVLFLIGSNFGTAAIDAKMEQVIHSIEMQASTLAEECLSGIRTITAYLATDEMGDRYATILEKSKAKGIRKSPVRAAQYSISYFVVLNVYALGFWYGTRLFLQGKISSGGSVVIIILCINQATNALRLLLPVYSVMAKAKAAYASLSSVIEMKPRIDPFSRQGDMLDTLHPQIRFQDVHFAYPSRPTVKVLDGLNVTFQANTTTAVVGPSGCGKSTLVALLERWHDAPDGGIKIDDKPVQALNITSLRSKIRLVQQNASLFNDTIYNNVAHGLIATPLGGIPESQKRRLVTIACKDVHAHEFIERLPKGYDTVVGNRGSLLSGGQIQRIVIARAVISDPLILIFDEATSALDAESELLVQSAINRAAKGRTTIVIAHKLATVKDADCIVMLKDGKVTDEGTHDSLLQTCHAYQDIWKAQSLASDDPWTETETKSTIHDQIDSEKAVDEGSLQDDVRDEETIVNEPPNTTMTFYRTTHSLFTSSPTLRTILLASLTASLLAGAIYPLQALIFAKDVSSYQHYGRALTASINFWSLMFFVIALASLLSFSATGTLSSVGGTITARVYREAYFRALLGQPIPYFDDTRQTPGFLTAGLASYPAHLEGFVVVLSTLFITVVNLSSVIMLGLAVSWRFALVAIFGALPVIVLGGYLRVRIATTRNANLTGPLMESAQYAAEVVGNLRTVSAFAMEREVCKGMGGRMEGAWRGFYRATVVEMPLFAFSHTANLLGTALSFWYSGHLLVDGKITAVQLWIVFLGIVSGSEAAGEFFASASSIVHARSSCSTITRAIASSQDRTSSGDQVNEKPTSSSITFDNVSFRYSEDVTESVLRDLSFHVPQGGSLAIVGRSGSGKSTIVSLLKRFYDVTSGEIRLGSTNVNAIDASSYCAKVSLVSQDTQLFEGTVRENILLGVQKAWIAEETLYNAARDASIHDFILSLPEGYNTPCGRKGRDFSGGQRQRIAIARALVRDPSILLLDEATSALDSVSEMEVRKALQNASTGRTTVAIAHRLSTIQHYDRILVLEKGSIVEQGSHAQLKALRGVYWKMCQMQDLD